jgi:hypothetical protein
MSSQPKISTSLVDQSRVAYKKLLRTTYMLATRGQPMSVYKTVVDVQKANGVQLITGTDSGKCAAQFVEELSRSIKIKVASLLNESSFFAMLSDGSQARKTQSEKELVLVRLIFHGSPTYLCAGLENIDDYGDASALNVKKSLDNVFSSSDKVKLSECEYLHKLSINRLLHGQE